MFKKIDTLFRGLIWKGGQARISLQTLQLSTREGGLAVPHPQSYFLAAQLQHLKGSKDPIGGINKELMILGAPHKTVLEVLEADSFGNKTPTVRLAMKIWKAVKLLSGQGGVTECTPLWDNRNLQELETIGRIKEWEIKGINRLVQLYEGRMLKTFTTLREEYDIPKHTFYKYLQIRHALNAQFGEQGPVWCNTNIYQRIFNPSRIGGFISEIYPYICGRSIERPELLKSRGKWEEDLGTISNEQ